MSVKTNYAKIQPIARQTQDLANHTPVIAWGRPASVELRPGTITGIFMEVWPEQKPQSITEEPENACQKMKQ